MAIPASMGFVLSDLGLIFLNSSQFHFTQGMGILLSLLGALTFAESLLSLNVIDMLLPYSGNPTIYPIHTHYDLLFFAHRDSMPRPHASPNQNQSHSDFGDIGHGDFALGSVGLCAHLLALNRTEEWGVSSVWLFTFRVGLGCSRSS